MACAPSATNQTRPPQDPDIRENIAPSSKWVPPSVKFQPRPPKGVPKGEPATVIVQFKIGIDGKPSRIDAIQGPKEYYGYAEGYVALWLFNPATIDGQPAASWFRLTVQVHPKK